MKTSTKTLATALRVLAVEIKSEDGIANAAIAEAAERLEQLENALRDIENLRYGWEGDCGAVKIASEALGA